MYKIAAVALLTAVLCACTWVRPTPEGEKVRVASADAVADCERLGKITVSLKYKLGRIERKPEKVATELETLARNEGAVMHGDTVVPQSNPTEGRQEYGVYDCSFAD